MTTRDASSPHTLSPYIVPIHRPHTLSPNKARGYLLLNVGSLVTIADCYFSSLRSVLSAKQVSLQIIRLFAAKDKDMSVVQYLLCGIRREVESAVGRCRYDRC